MNQECKESYIRICLISRCITFLPLELGFKKLQTDVEKNYKVEKSVKNDSVFWKQCN